MMKSILIAALLSVLFGCGQGVALRNSGLNHSGAHYGIISNCVDMSSNVKLEIKDGCPVGEKHARLNELAISSLSNQFAKNGATLIPVDRKTFVHLQDAKPELIRELFARNSIDAMVNLACGYSYASVAGATAPDLTIFFKVILQDGQLEYNRPVIQHEFKSINMENENDRQRVFAAVYNDYLTATAPLP